MSFAGFRVVPSSKGLVMYFETYEAAASASLPI